MSTCTPLHESLYTLCRKQINQDPEFLERKGWKSAAAIDTALFDEYRDFKFVRTVNWAYKNSRFYKKLYDAHGVDVSQIRSLQDIGKLPFSDAADLAGHEYEFLCQSQSEAARTITFTSSGTVGPQKRIFFSMEDIETMTDYMAVGLLTVTDEHGCMQIFLPDGPVMGQADLLGRGVKKMKGRAVPIGMKASSQEQIACILEHGSTVLFGETRLMYRITREMESVYDLKSLGVEVLFLTTSYLCDSLAEYLENAWGARISNHYGLVEMGLGLAVDCEKGCQYHYDQLDVAAEVIDSASGEKLPYGQEGELVFTSLSRRLMPLIRYRSHDYASMGRSGEACGFLERISHVRHRAESSVALGEERIYPTLFDNELFRIPELMDYDLELAREDGQDVLTVKVEPVQEGREFTQAVIERVASYPQIGRNLASGLLSEIRVEYLPKGSLKSETHFKKVIKDHR